jgi:dTDP-4-dehydrorhamnose reductase
VSEPPLRWLVLGGHGRLGRVLCANRPWLIPVGRAVEATCADDVRGAAGYLDVFGVLNLAAAADVARCERDPMWAFEGNVLTARGAAQGAGRAGKPFVHVSTDYVFGERHPEIVSRSAPFWPGNGCIPVNVYGTTKRAAEEQVLNAAMSWVSSRFTIARMSFLADPPGYAWVIGGVRVTKEWIDASADRLVTDRETTLDALLHERYPDVPVVPYAEGLARLPYRLPADLRLGGAWKG